MNVTTAIGWVLYFLLCFLIGVAIQTSPHTDTPPVEVVQETEAEPATRAECIPCNGEGNICGKMCVHCKGAGTVPIVHLTLYPDNGDGLPDNEPDCQFKLHTLRK